MPADDRTRRKLAVFARLAADLADLSTCRRLRVGAVVITPTMSEVVALGYNGPASGLPNDSCRGDAGTCGCAHAEANALVKLRTTEGGLVLICTHSSCEACASLAVNCGRVRHVVYGNEYRDPAGLRLLSAAGVSVSRLVDLL